MKKLLSLLIVFCVLLIQVGFTNAAEVEIFGISNELNGMAMSTTETRNGVSGSTLYRIDYKTGFATPVGSVGSHDCRGLDFHPLKNKLYAVCFGMSHNQVLLDINPFTGHGTEIVELQFEDGDFGIIVDISFREDGTLFAYVDSKEDDFLAILDPETGLIQNLGPTGLTGGGNGIAINDELYNANTELLPTLNVLNQTNGGATFKTNLIVPPPANDFPLILSMDKDTVNNIFYGVLDNEEREYTYYLVTIDVDSGQVDLIGVTVDGLDALAVRNPKISNIPTLSQYGLILVALALLAAALFVLRRRNKASQA